MARKEPKLITLETDDTIRPDLAEAIGPHPRHLRAPARQHALEVRAFLAEHVVLRLGVVGVVRVDEVHPGEEGPLRLRTQPLERRIADVFPLALGLRPLAVRARRHAIVVVVEAAGQTEARIEHPGGEEGTGAQHNLH